MDAQNSWFFLRGAYNHSVDLKDNDSRKASGTVDWMNNNDSPNQKWRFLHHVDGQLHKIVSAIEWPALKVLRATDREENSDIVFGPDVPNDDWSWWYLLDGGGGTALILNLASRKYLNGFAALNRIPTGWHIAQTANSGLVSAHWVLAPAGLRLFGPAHSIESVRPRRQPSANANTAHQVSGTRAKPSNRRPKNSADSKPKK